MLPNGAGKVIGALANADDDTFRPKMECPTCGLVLYRHNFSTHYRIHTGEMPFSCHYCLKRFRTTSALKVHIRSFYFFYFKYSGYLRILFLQLRRNFI